MEVVRAYARPHRALLLRGLLATMGVVLFRLAMPWPLRGVVEAVFPGGMGRGHVVDYLPEGDPVLWLGGIYVLLALGLGLSEMVQRVNIMRFSARTVHDMRSEAVRGAASLPPQGRSAVGDIIARIVGDSARVKAGLSGILVHGLQNGLLFIAVCAILMYISVQLGLIFLVSGCIALIIGIRASGPVAKVAARQRRKEGEYASALREGLETGDLELEIEGINASSAQKDVRTTKIITRSSVLVHLVLAVAVGLGLWYGAYGVRSGSIAPGELFLFIAYALTVHRRMVQVGRQAARTGKVIACVDRLSDFCLKARPEGALPAGTPLETGLRLENVRLSGHGAGPRVGSTDLTILPGTRVVVLGHIGSGKSSLLKLLAGAEQPDRGRIFWDSRDLTGGALSRMVAYLPQDPVFAPLPLWKLIGLSGPDASLSEHEETLRRIEAWKVIERLGLGSRVGSSGMSRNEARLLRLSGILLSDRSPVWVLDNPVQGLERSKGRSSIEEITRSSRERTVVIALSEPAGLEGFDRVLYMRRGKIRFDGTPEQWEEWRRAGREGRKNLNVVR